MISFFTASDPIDPSASNHITYSYSAFITPSLIEMGRDLSPFLSYKWILLFFLFRLFIKLFLFGFSFILISNFGFNSFLKAISSVNKSFLVFNFSSFLASLKAQIDTCLNLEPHQLKHCRTSESSIPLILLEEIPCLRNLSQRVEAILWLHPRLKRGMRHLLPQLAEGTSVRLLPLD